MSIRPDLVLLSAKLVVFLDNGGVFDMKQVLGIDENDWFYRIEPVSFNHPSGEKRFIPEVKHSRPLPDTQQETFTFHSLGGKHTGLMWNNATGLVTLGDRVTELKAYVLAYGRG